jgi:hypothetical protein
MAKTTDKVVFYRATIEHVSKLKRLAETEQRKRGAMARVLVEEGLKRRAKAISR